MNLDLLKSSYPLPAECPFHCEYDVFSYADGTISDENEKGRIENHLAECAFCRELLSNYVNAKAEENVEKKSGILEGLREIIVSAAGGLLAPVQGLILNAKPAFTLNSGEDKKRIDFSPIDAYFPAVVSIISLEDAVSLKLESMETKKAVYLIQENEVKVAPFTGTFAGFDRIAYGKYILSLDMKTFVSIEIRKG